MLSPQNAHFLHKLSHLKVTCTCYIHAHVHVVSLTVALTYMYVHTVICENFVKKFRFTQSDENILCKNCLLVLIYTVNIWRVFDMNENIVTRKFLTQKICKQN